MSNEELCITILINFGIFHIVILSFVLLIHDKIDKIQKILKKLSNEEDEYFS